MVPPDSRGISRVPRYSGYVWALQAFGYRAATYFGWPFKTIRLAFQVPYDVLQPHAPGGAWFGLIRVRSPLLTESRLISFPQGTEMFHFPWFPLHAYSFSVQ